MFERDDLTAASQRRAIGPSRWLEEINKRIAPKTFWSVRIRGDDDWITGRFRTTTVVSMIHKDHWKKSSWFTLWATIESILGGGSDLIRFSSFDTLYLVIPFRECTTKVLDRIDPLLVSLCIPWWWHFIPSFISYQNRNKGERQTGKKTQSCLGLCTCWSRRVLKYTFLPFLILGLKRTKVQREFWEPTLTALLAEQEYKTLSTRFT